MPVGLADGRKAAADKALRERNGEHVMRLSLARKLEENGRYQSSLGHYSCAARYYSQAAKTYTAAQLFEAAFSMAEAAVGQHAAQAKSCFTRGDYKNAAQAYRAAADGCIALQEANESEV